MKTLVYTGNEKMEQTIGRCDVCYVGMVDSNETPYVIPMNFGYRDGVVYLHSAPEGRSIVILERNPKVCLTFSTGHRLVFQHPEVACSYRTRSESVIAFGTVRFEEDDNRKVEALNLIMKQYTDKEFTYSSPAVRNVKVWTVQLEEATCKEFGIPHYKQTKDNL